MEIEGVQLKKKYYFIDESGDPNYFGRHNKLLVGTDGFQPYLIVGMIETESRKAIRKAVVDFTDFIRNDVLYNSIPSIKNDKQWYLHACNDHAEVRIQFFERLRKLGGFNAHIVVAKKNVEIFRTRYNNRSSEFYFDVVQQLLKGRLTGSHQHQIYLAERQGNTLPRFADAVKNSITQDEYCQWNVELVNGKHMPEISIIDYLMWAIQRNLLKGKTGILGH